MTAYSTDFSCVDLKSDMPDRLKNAVVAIGNFDGVHRGHQAVLALTKDIASSENRPAIVMTFEPHPRNYFTPDESVFRLTSKSQKSTLLHELGLDGIVVVPFDKSLANTSAEEFVAGILVGKLGVGHVVTGYNFHFGKARQGTPVFLQEAGNRFGFDVTTVPSFGDEGGESVSSSRIRSALASGNVSEAAGLLGYRWNVTGKVQQGKMLGRTLGFPTANLVLPDYTRLTNGIYAVRVRRENGSLHDGVASFGRRPTFDNGAELFETFLFDFDDDLYGENIIVSLFGFLREEGKFASAEALVGQMKKDESEARALLVGVQPLSTLDGVLNFTA
jgi:riboflavin kinase/FMN adenylyltransferase